jgi:hypothetical protein
MPRELAQRSTGPVEITLYWDACGDEVMVELIDRGGGASFQVFVAPDRALDAFNHPYAYASTLEPEREFAIRVD